MTGYEEDLLEVCSADLPWWKLSGCDILVTGATGLVGSCLVEALMLNPRRDYRVHALGRDAGRARERFAAFWGEGSFRFVRHDVTLPLRTGVGYHYIIHAAGGASPGVFCRKPVEVIMSNVSGLHNLMSYGLGHGMRRLLLVSSGEVYGEGDGRAFTEDYSGYVDCTSPRSCYPSSKRAAETLCASYVSEYGADAVIARPCHVYGPGFTEGDDRVCAQFIRNALAGEDIVMKGGGEQFRSWCYVADCASALLHILLKGARGQAYNIADGGSEVSIRGLAELAAGVAGSRVVAGTAGEAERRGYNPVAKSVFSTAKLEALGWKPRTHVREGLEKTIGHLRRRPVKQG